MFRFEFIAKKCALRNAGEKYSKLRRVKLKGKGAKLGIRLGHFINKHYMINPGEMLQTCVTE